MECKYNGSDRRLDYLFDNANHVEVDPIRTAGEAVADITIDGETTRLYAPAVAAEPLTQAQMAALLALL